MNINKGELWKGFKRSDYITALWNWFMGFAGKTAEPVLFASVLYSGYQLVPGVPQAGANVNAIMFVIQQAALDIGGMGLMKLAKHANLKKTSFPYCVGVILVGLMIANVIMASLEKIMQMPPQVTGGIEGILIVARAVMAVLFGHAIHSLKDDEKEEVLAPNFEEIIAQAIASEKQQITESHDAQIGELKGQIEQLKILLEETQKVEQKVSLAEHESIPSDLPQKLDENAQLFEPAPGPQVNPKVTRKLDSRELRKYEDFSQKVEQKIKPKSSGKILVLDKNLYTKSEAAKIAKCSISEIENALENGELIASKSGEKILKSSLEKFVQDRKKFGQKRPTLRVISREEGA